jgi:hypothetical protein
MKTPQQQAAEYADSIVSFVKQPAADTNNGSMKTEQEIKEAIVKMQELADKDFLNGVNTFSMRKHSFVEALKWVLGENKEYDL